MNVNHAKRILSCALALIMLLSAIPVNALGITIPSGDGVAVHTGAKEIYVSTTGDDSNSGTFEAPLRTITAARDLIRTMNDDMDKDIVVYLRQGVYRQTETLEFTKEDSGTNGHTITYRAYGDEYVSVSGGQLVTGWQLFDEEKGIYCATFGREVDTRQLYVNGNRATRARSVGGINGCILDPGAAAGSLGMATTDIEMASWKNQESIEFSFVGAWTLPRCIVQKIEINPSDPSQAIITMAQPCWNNARNKGLSSVTSAPRWVENAYELLDLPGEWYLDKTGAIGGEAYTFYYKPLEGEDMSTAEVITPVLEEVMHIESDNIDVPVSNLQFMGITFEHGTWLRPNTMGMVDAQDNNIREPENNGDMATGGNVYLRATQNIVFNSCEFARMGNTALFMHQGNKDNLVVGCHFYDTSAQAVKIGDVRYSDYRNFYQFTATEGSGLSDVTMDDWDWRWLQSNNDVINNVIHDIGREFYSSAAISACVIEESDFSHNEIFNVPYSGFHIGYGWATWPSMISPMGNNRIQYNYIHDCMLEQKDGGAIYAIGIQACGSGEAGWARKSIISNNYIVDQKNEYGSIYLDEGANYYDVYDNVIQNTPRWLMVKHARNHIHGNFYNQTVMSSSQSPLDTGTAKLENNTYFSGSNLPEGALAIAAQAGVEDGYEHNHYYCAMSKGKMTLEYDREEEYPLTATVTGLMNTIGSDLIRFTIQYEGLNGKVCKAVMNGQVLTGTGDENGKVVFGEPIRVSDIPEILGKEGLKVSVQFPMPDGEFSVTAAWEKVAGDHVAVLLSGSKSLYGLSDDYSKYDQVLDLNLSEYEIGAITATENPDKIAFTPNANVQITVEENEKDGRFIRFNKTGATSASYTASIPVMPASMGTTIIKYKIRAHQSNARIYGFGVNTATSNLTAATLLHENNRIVHEYSSAQQYDLGRYTVDQWDDVTLILNLDTDTYDAVVNGQLTGKNLPLNTQDGKQVVALTFGMYKDHKGSFDFKDIAVYTSKVPAAALIMEDASQDSSTMLKLSIHNAKNLPEGVQLQYRVTLPEGTLGNVKFGESDTVAISNGVAVSSAFDIPATGEILETMVTLPEIAAGSHTFQAELFYTLNGTEHVLAQKQLTLTVLTTFFELDLTDYEIGKKISEGTNPLGISISGESTTNTVTVVEIDGEKAIKLTKVDNSSRPEFSISLEGVSGYIEISADIKGPESAAIAYTMCVFDEADSIAQVFHREGDIWHWGHNNSVVRDGKYDLSQWYNAKIVINPETKTYDIYINGTPRTAGIAWKSGCTGNLLTLTSGATSFTSGTYYMKNLTVKASAVSQPEIHTAYEMDLRGYTVGEKISESNNTEGGITVTGETGGNAVTVEEIDGEKAIKFYKAANTTTSPTLQIPISGVSGYVEVTAKVKGPGADAIAYTLLLHDGVDYVAQAMHRDGQIWHWDRNGGVVRVGKYDANNWQSITVQLDPTNKTASIYLNGTLLTKNVPWKAAANTGEVTRIDSMFYSQSKGGTFYLKDLMVRYSEKPIPMETAAAPSVNASASSSSARQSVAGTVKTNDEVLGVTSAGKTSAIVFDEARSEYISRLRTAGVGSYYIDLLRRLTEDFRLEAEQYEALAVQSDIMIALVKEVNAEALTDPDAFDSEKFTQEQKAELDSAFNAILDILDLYYVDSCLINNEFLNTNTEGYKAAVVIARIFDRNTRELIMTVRTDDTVKNWSVIASVSDLEAIVCVDESFELPAQIEATMDDGTKRTVPVTWDGEADTSELGTFTFKGYIEEYPEMVTFTLTVSKIIVLTEDVKKDTIVLIDGMILDLNGHTLEADYVITFKGNALIDSAGGVGVLKCENVRLDADNPMMPVWDDEAEGYRFFSMADHQMYESQADNSFAFIAKPALGNMVNDAYLANAEKSGLTVKARIRWTSNGSDVEQLFTFHAEDLKDTYQDDSRVLSLTVTGAGNYKNKLWTTMWIESETGVIWTGAELEYTGVNGQ